MSVSTRSFLEICQETARSLGAYESGTLTAVTTALATAANYPFKTARTNASKVYEGCEIYFTNGQFTPNPQGVAAYSASAGTFTPDTAWTDGGTDPTTFDIYKKGIRIGDIKQAINRALRQMRYVTLIPLTLIPDGDCDAAGTSSWGTAVNAAASKVTAAANVLRGAQAIFVNNSDVDGYLPSAVIDVTPEEPYYYLQARVRADVGTAELVAYDNTNSAEIKSETWGDQGWGTVSFQFTLPSTCDQLVIRLQGQEATADTYWDDIILLRMGAREIALPDYVVNPGQVRYVYWDIERDQFDRDAYQEYEFWRVRPNMNNPNQMFSLQLWPQLSRPVWAEVARPYATLSADTDTTMAPREWIETAAAVKLLEEMINRAPGLEVAAWKAEWAVRRSKLRRLNAIYMPRPVGRNVFNEPPNTPSMLIY